MRDEIPKSIKEVSYNSIVNLQCTDGTHWVLIMKRKNNDFHYFDSHDVETKPKSLDKFVDLESDDRKKQDGESFCGSCRLYMIYPSARGFKIKRSLNSLINRRNSNESF